MTHYKDHPDCRVEVDNYDGTITWVDHGEQHVLDQEDALWLSKALAEAVTLSENIEGASKLVEGDTSRFLESGSEDDDATRDYIDP